MPCRWAVLILTVCCILTGVSRMDTHMILPCLLGYIERLCIASTSFAHFKFSVQDCHEHLAMDVVEVEVKYLTMMRIELIPHMPCRTILHT